MIRNGKNYFRTRAVLLGICIAGSALLQACGDRQEYSYATLADAAKAGEISRGWIPDYLPTSSHAIHIVYDPSSPRTWCVFEFSPADSQSLKKNLTSVNVLPQRLRRVDGPGASWWPDFLKGDLDVARFHGNGFEAYVAEEPDVQSDTDLVLFAIDWAKGRAFFYRTARNRGETGETGGQTGRFLISSSSMARLSVVNVPHHVTQRGNARQFILTSDTERSVYLDLLRKYAKLHELSLLGYCLMSNHVHLIVIPRKVDSPAAVLKQTHGRYATYWNALHNSSGHVWQGRFYSCPLDDAHLWIALRYTERNPRGSALHSPLSYLPGDHDHAIWLRGLPLSTRS